MKSKTNKPLTLFKLIMMAVVAIDSIKNLPSNAQYGSSLIFFYLIGICIFFIPSALVCAELSTSLPKTGGAYIWIREAFGKPTAFMAAWIQWLIAITWAPTILSFMMASAFYYIAPALADNKMVMLFSIVLIFWAGLFFISRGIEISSRISAACAIIGVILPMIFISILGMIWLIGGHPSQIDLNFSNTNFTLNSDHLRLFIPLLFSLMGMEIIGVHADDVQNPQKNYPIALGIAAILICLTSIPASLAIAVVIPNEQISLTTGVIASFSSFLNEFQLNYLLPFIVIAVILGCFGIFYSWLLAVSKYLLSVSQDGCLPQFLQSDDPYVIPAKQLILQGIVFTLLSSAFILMPSVSNAFWLLTASCGQFGLLFYILLFGAAIYLRFRNPNLTRPFKVGRSPVLITGMSSLAILTCLIAFCFGFIPPHDMQKGNFLWFEFSISLCMLGGLSIGFLIYLLSQFSPKKQLSTQIQFD